MMKTTMLAIAAAMAAGTLAHAQEAVQWRVADGGNGHWYRVIYSQEIGNSQIAARAIAHQSGAELATFSSLDEWSFASSAAVALDTLGPVPKTMYLGGILVDTQWQWLDGSLWPDDAPWFTPGVCSGVPAPNGDGDALQSFCEGLYWDDRPIVGAGIINKALFEWSADCNGDGIVDYGQCRDGSLPDYNGNNIPDCCEQGVPCEVGNYPVQWRVEDGGNGNWYLAKRWDAPKTWEEAKTSAEQTGGHLACLTSEAENNFVYYSSTLTQPGCGPGQEGWHIGGFQDLAAPDYSEPAGGWRWISGETWQYTAWLTAVPGGDRPNNFGPGGEQYLKMSELPYAPYWDDVGVGSGQTHMCGAIIEWSADCNGDGIVDFGQILLGELSDANANGIPDTCECDADINDDGVVNGADISVLLGYWGLSGKNVVGDLTGDGMVNGADLAQLLGSWGECP